MKPPSQAPLFTDAWDLSAWVLSNLDDRPASLPTSLCRLSLALLDAVVLALKDIDRDQQIAIADTSLIRLRMRIRLAVETGLLADRQALFLLQKADSIGRQLGGWIKSLDSA